MSYTLPDSLVFANGVDAETGEVLPIVSARAADRVPEDLQAVRSRGRGAEGFLATAEVDPNDLSQAGWGVIFPPGTPDAVKKALEPLLKRRQAEAGGLYREFDGGSAPQKGERVEDWLARHGTGFAAVDPENGVPLYLLIVGGPDSLPFEFQYQLDAYWCVGRLALEAADDYRAYAEHIEAYERNAVPHGKDLTVFATRNDGDRSTGFFYNQVAKPFVSPDKPLGRKQGFRLSSVLAEAATKTALVDLLTGKAGGRRPALLFTGTHGLYPRMTDPEQSKKIGAIVSQDWPGPGTPIGRDDCVLADDLKGQDLQVHGLVHFLFACYGGACPKYDTYTPRGQERKQIAPGPVLAQLPQVLLTHGAQAVITHVDRAFSCSFQTPRLTPQTQDFRDVFVRLMQGQRVGQAMDAFNLRAAVLGGQLTDMLRDREHDPESVTDDQLTAAWLSRDDARNYAVLGDPAVRLRVDVMA